MVHSCEQLQPENVEMSKSAPPPRSKCERLKKARIDAGYRSAAQAAKALEVSISTYTTHENGSRDFREDVAQTYAEKFGVDLAWLLLGEHSGQSSPATISELASSMNDGVGVGEEELFMEAYREARDIEWELLRGVGPRLSFAKMVNVIYAEKLAEKRSSLDDVDDD